MIGPSFGLDGKTPPMCLKCQCNLKPAAFVAVSHDMLSCAQWLLRQRCRPCVAGSSQVCAMTHMHATATATISALSTHAPRPSSRTTATSYPASNEKPLQLEGSKHAVPTQHLDAGTRRSVTHSPHEQATSRAQQKRTQCVQGGTMPTRRHGVYTYRRREHASVCTANTTATACSTALHVAALVTTQQAAPGRHWQCGTATDRTHHDTRCMHCRIQQSLTRPTATAAVPLIDEHNFTQIAAASTPPTEAPLQKVLLGMNTTLLHSDTRLTPANISYVGTACASVAHSMPAASPYQRPKVEGRGEEGEGRKCILPVPLSRPKPNPN